jgi:hypothetical protein
LDYSKVMFLGDKDQAGAFRRNRNSRNAIKQLASERKAPMDGVISEGLRVIKQLRSIRIDTP